MVTINRAQRVALKRVFDRGPVYGDFPSMPRLGPLTYREFRGTVQQGFGCVMVKWCNMWLGIEPDGHTHS